MHVSHFMAIVKIRLLSEHSFVPITVAKEAKEEIGSREKVEAWVCLRRRLDDFDIIIATCANFISKGRLRLREKNDQWVDG